MCHPALGEHWISSTAKTNLLKTVSISTEHPLPPPPLRAQPWHECMDAFRHDLFLRSVVRAVQRPIALHVNAITVIVEKNNRNAPNWHAHGCKCEMQNKGSACCAATCKVPPIDAERERESTRCHSASARMIGWCFLISLLQWNISCSSSGLIEISTVERGVVSLYGVRSELFVAMNSRGRLYGTVGMHSISFIVQQCQLMGSWK